VPCRAVPCRAGLDGDAGRPVRESGGDARVATEP
jgi:hypothetical protein